jgi:hypothetical protein
LRHPAVFFLPPPREGRGPHFVIPGPAGTAPVPGDPDQAGTVPS